MSSVLDLLTPGSVWIKLHGKLANSYIKVLFVTNQDLKPLLHAKYPPQVIYANESGKILSRDIDSFIEQFQFYNVDPELEQRLVNLLNDSVIDQEEQLDTNIPNYGISTDKSFVDQYLDDLSVNKTNNTTKEEISASFIFISDDSLPAISNDILTECFVGFAQEPTQMYDKIQIKLTFALNTEKGLTLDSLYKVFCPQEDNNTVDAFVIKTPYETIMPTWNLFVSVNPSYTTNGLFGIVILTNDSEDKPIEVETQEIPQSSEISVTENSVTVISVNEHGILTPVLVQTTDDISDQIQVVQEEQAIQNQSLDSPNQIIPHLVEEHTPKTE